MTDGLPDWDHDHPFEVYRPTPAEDARAKELWEMCVNDDPRFGECFVAACDDVLTERNLPAMWVALMKAGRDLVEGNCSDLRLMKRRVSADVKESRGEALKEAIYRDDT